MGEKKSLFKPQGTDTTAIESEQKPHRKRWLLLLLLLAILFGISTSVIFTSREQVVEIDGFYCRGSSSGYTIVGLTGTHSSQTLVIPETLGGKKVAEISDKAFTESEMKSFIVPSGITQVGKNAFDGEGVFSIYMVGRKDLQGMKLDESWSGVGEVIFQDVRPQIGSPPKIKDVDDFTGDVSGSLDKDMSLDDNNTLPDWSDTGEQLPEFNQSNSNDFKESGQGNGGKDDKDKAAKSLLLRIEIVAAPTKTSYIQAESFNPQGMVVKAIYSDGFSQLVTNYSYPREALTLADTSMQISFSDTGEAVSARVPIIVTKRSALKLNVKAPPKKTEYVEGTRFNKEGMVVEVIYSNLTFD